MLSYPENVIPSLRFQFCPICAAPLVREVIFDDNIPRVRCPNCDWIQLSSNVVGVLVIAHTEDAIAVIVPPNEDGVGFPAGLVEYGEDPEMAAVREVLEETGLEVKIARCLGWFFQNRSTFPGPVVHIVYEATIVGGTIKGSDEGAAEMILKSDSPIFSSRRKGSQQAYQYFLSKTESS